MKKQAQHQLHCTVCTTVIPAERIVRESVTCSAGCANELRNIRRRQRDLKKCRFCNQPSTPEERKLFKQWIESQGKLRKPGRPKGSTKAKIASAQAEFTEMMHIH